MRSSSVGSGRAKSSGPEQIARDLRAIRIFNERSAGQTLAAIAAQEGISTGRVSQIINEQLSAQVSASVARMRDLESARLDRLQAAFWDKALKGNVRAGNVVVKVLARRAKLFGLDARPNDSLEEWRAESAAAGESVKAKLVALNGKLLRQEAAADGRVFERSSMEANEPSAAFVDLAPLDRSEAEQSEADIYGERPYR